MVNFDFRERLRRKYGGVTPGNFKKIFDAKSYVWGQFGPETKLFEGQLTRTT